MESLYFMIPVSIIFVILAVGLYFWAVKSGQYDDLDLEGQRIFFEPEPTAATPPVPAPGPQEPSQ